MALYIVQRENEYYPLSTWLEDGDDSMFEPVQVVTGEDGRTKVVAYYGISVPVEKVRDCCVQIMVEGYDNQVIRGDLRECIKT